VRLASTIVGHHMRPLLLAGQDHVSARAVYRFFRDTGDAGIDVLLHALADHRATYPPGEPASRWPMLLSLVNEMMAEYWQRPGERIKPKALLTGHDLLWELDIHPGPLVGELLEAVREAQACGEVASREEALGLVRRRLAS
jgi:hypothetical protein